MDHGCYVCLGDAECVLSRIEDGNLGTGINGSTTTATTTITSTSSPASRARAGAAVRHGPAGGGGPGITVHHARHPVWGPTGQTNERVTVSITTRRCDGRRRHLPAGLSVTRGASRCGSGGRSSSRACLLRRLLRGRRATASPVRPAKCAWRACARHRARTWCVPMGRCAASGCASTRAVRSCATPARYATKASVCRIARVSPAQPVTNAIRGPGCAFPPAAWACPALRGRIARAAPASTIARGRCVLLGRAARWGNVWMILPHRSARRRAAGSWWVWVAAARASRRAARQGQGLPTVPGAIWDPGWAPGGCGCRVAGARTGLRLRSGAAVA
jgi:hypothetical protein